MNESTGNQVASSADGERTAAIRFHLALGWWSLLLFLLLGLTLEVLHGFKIDYYLSVSNETRRLMWTLAHAHGTFLAIVHIGFAATVAALPAWRAASRRRASRCLTFAALAIPLGFFLGGVTIYGSDPNVTILLVPVGAIFLAAGVALTAREAMRRTNA